MKRLCALFVCCCVLLQPCAVAAKNQEASLRSFPDAQQDLLITLAALERSALIGANNEGVNGSISPLSCFDSTFIIRENGSLYGWGANSWETSFSADKYDIDAPILLDVVSIVAGQFAAFAISSDGTLWGWGSGLFHMLPEEFSGVPVHIMSDVKQVAVGSHHVVALKTDSTLWAWGKNDHSQMAGHTQSSSVSADAPIKLQSDISLIAASGDATYALKNDGTLIGWGGEVVRASGEGDVSSPIEIARGVKSASATHMGILIIQSDNSLWVKGASTLLADDGCTHANFTKLLDDVAFCSAGIAIQKDGSLWTWGNNEGGQLMDGTSTHRCTPHKVAEGILYAETGLTDTVAITDTGKLLMAGSSCTPAASENPSAPETVLTDAMFPSTALTIQCLPYSDVSVFQWFYPYAKECLGAGLLNGVGDNRFAPAMNMTEGQAVAIAARLHAQNAGSTLPIQSDTNWYRPIRDYALDAGILLSEEDGDGSTAISRHRFIALLARAVTQAEYPALKAPTTIPDVDSTTEVGAFIAMLYQAGILTGIDDTGTFDGESSITRAEVAAILSRLANPELRT